MAEMVLGVRMDGDTTEEALAKVLVFLQDEGQHMVCTPNPEMLVAAQADTHFKDILNEADLNICDGKGISMLTRFRIPRVTGVDFMQDMCGLAATQKKTVYLLGSGVPSVVEACKTTLVHRYRALRIVGTHPGLHITQTKKGIVYSDKENDSVIDDIIMKAPDILFVAFGHGKQEKWIHEQLPHLPSVRIAMGVGGAFDFIAGKARRAPSWMQAVGLEWLWRVVREPKRVVRIAVAVIYFPILFFLHNHNAS